MKHEAVIYMLDGAVRRGKVDAADGEGLITERPGAFGAAASHFNFESADGKEHLRIAFDAVRTIYPPVDGEDGIHTKLRFFDTASIPLFLWVRLTFVDGEVLEGMVENRQSAFSGSLICLSIPDSSLGQMPVLVPRSVVAELQVITTR